MLQESVDAQKAEKGIAADGLEVIQKQIESFDIDLSVDDEIDAAVRFADESPPAREDVMMSTVLAPEGDS